MRDSIPVAGSSIKLMSNASCYSLDTKADPWSSVINKAFLQYAYNKTCLYECIPHSEFGGVVQMEFIRGKPCSSVQACNTACYLQLSEVSKCIMSCSNR